MKQILTNRIYYTLTTITAAHLLASFATWALVYFGAIHDEPNEFQAFVFAIVVLSPVLTAMKARWYPGAERGWMPTGTDAFVILSAVLLEGAGVHSTNMLWRMFEVTSSFQPVLGTVLYFALYIACTALCAAFAVHMLVPAKINVKF